MTDAKNIPLGELELPMRIWNVFKNNGFKTIGDVLALDEHELLRLPNFGRKSLNEFNGLIAPYGLKVVGQSRRHLSLSVSGLLFEKIKGRALVNEKSVEAEAIAILAEAVGEDRSPVSVLERLHRLETAVFSNGTINQ